MLEVSLLFILSGISLTTQCSQRFALTDRKSFVLGSVEMYRVEFRMAVKIAKGQEI